MKRLVNKWRYYSTKQQQQILVHGVSLEGITAALALKQANPNCKIDVVDSDKGYESIQGNISFCAPAVTKIFEKMNVLADVQTIAQPLSHFTICSDRSSNWVVHKLSTIASGYQAPPFLAVPQKQLIDLLIEKAKQQQISIFLHENVKLFKQNENNTVQAQFQKSFAKVNYDLIVGADGLQGKTTNHFFANTTTTKPQTCGYEHNGVIMNCPAELDYEDRAFEWWTAKTRMGVIPLKNNKIFVYSSQHAPMELGAKRMSLQIFTFMLRAFRRFRGYGIENLLDQMERITNNPMMDKTVTSVSYSPKRYILDACQNAQNNVVLIGEASHSIDNSLYHATTVAVEDAWVLAQCVGKHADKLPLALQEFNKQRLDRVQLLDTQSGLFSKYFTSAPFRWVKVLQMSYMRFLVKYRMNKAWMRPLA